MEMNLDRWNVACAQKVGMRNKVCGPKVACMRTNLGQWDVAYAQEVHMENKICGPKGAGSTGRGMRNKVYRPKDTCMRTNVGRRDVACDRKNGTKNKVCGPEGPWYEMFIPRAQLMSCPVKPYFSYLFFKRMPRPVDPRLFSCKCPSGPQTLFFIPTFRSNATSR